MDILIPLLNETDIGASPCAKVRFIELLSEVISAVFSFKGLTKLMVKQLEDLLCITRMVTQVGFAWGYAYFGDGDGPHEGLLVFERLNVPDGVWFLVSIQYIRGAMQVSEGL